VIACRATLDVCRELAWFVAKLLSPGVFPPRSDRVEGARVRRPLIVLLAANAFSITGNVFTMLAVPWFVLQTTGSAALTGVASAASALPLVISATFAGPLVDRVGPRRASVLSDLASGLIVVTIPALFLTAGLAFGVLLVLLFARWLLATPGDTARRAMVPDLAAGGGVAIERAAAAYDGVFRGATLVSAPLAGVMIAWLGPVPLLFADGATFLASAILIGSGVRRVAHDASGGAASGYLSRLGEGLAFLWRERLLRSAVAIILITNLLDIGLDQVLLPAYARQAEHDPRAFGLLLSAIFAGALAGTAAYGWAGARLPRRPTFALSLLIAGAVRPLVLAAGVPFGAALAVIALSGIACGPINPLLNVVQFERIPVRLRVRVLGAIAAGQFAGMPLGGLLAGFLTESAGLTAALLTFAALYVLASSPPFLSRSWKQINVAAPQPGAPAMQPVGRLSESHEM
jgi:MFS family permease